METHAESGVSGEHGDPIAPVLVGIVVIILAARVGGHFMEVIGQPAVFGDLRGRGLLIISSLAMCFAFTWAATRQQFSGSDACRGDDERRTDKPQPLPQVTGGA